MGKTLRLGSTPIAHREEYPSKDELLRALDERRNTLSQAYLRATPEELAKPMADPRIARIFPTVGRLIAYAMMFHEGTHLGQLAAWRKAAGLPAALFKLATK